VTGMEIEHYFVIAHSGANILSHQSVTAAASTHARRAAARDCRRGNPVAFLLHCRSPLLAQSRHPSCVRQCPLSGVKRTSRFQGVMSAFDPPATSAHRAHIIALIETLSSCSKPSVYLFGRFNVCAPAQASRSLPKFSCNSLDQRNPGCGSGFG
jgi:hypothetical protein